MPVFQEYLNFSPRAVPIPAQDGGCQRLDHKKALSAEGPVPPSHLPMLSHSPPSCTSRGHDSNCRRTGWDTRALPGAEQTLPAPRAPHPAGMWPPLPSRACSSTADPNPTQQSSGSASSCKQHGCLSYLLGIPTEHLQGKRNQVLTLNHPQTGTSPLKALPSCSRQTKVDFAYT